MFAERTNRNLSGNRLSEALARHRASGKRLFDLIASNPTECGFAYDSEIILAALRNPAALRYEPNPKGLESARVAVTEYYSARGAAVSAEDIVLTTSTSEAYSFVFRLLCNPGDEVLIPAPSYPLFGFLADIQDVKLMRYPLVYDHGWQIDFHSLQQAITPRTRGVIVVNPNNPTGHFVKENEFAKLNEVCLARGMALIADEVFLDFALGKEKPVSFAGNKAALTFVMSGLSKIAGLPQMKMAWVISSAPEEIGAGEARGNCGHLSFAECAGATGYAGVFGAAAGISETGDGAGAQKFGGAGPAASRAKDVRSTRGGGRVVCGFASAGYQER
jgi:aspartate/methionine/tyrosine aminotransferase